MPYLLLPLLKIKYNLFRAILYINIEHSFQLTIMRVSFAAVIVALLHLVRGVLHAARNKTESTYWCHTPEHTPAIGLCCYYFFYLYLHRFI